MREGYLPWYVQRENYREIGSSPGYAQPDGPESSRCARFADVYGIARRIEQVSEQVLQLNEGTVYTTLLRLQQRGWIASDWGRSQAKYYSITKNGRKQLARETENWERIAGVIRHLLRLEGQE